MMTEPLITVEDHFALEGRGLVLLPFLDRFADKRTFRPFSEMVRIERPDGTDEKLDADFNLEHFLMKDGSSRWHISVTIPAGTKETVPIGSKVFVTSQTVRGLTGDAPG